ncbi:MAG: hypothetical protein K2P76_11690 [Lachnospiraceae bacterium]|nr:hypothetical protein [Lachnospiraceae bacterium]MDE6981634.1 hypothetical protein [Lachnospiraceae bacterium]
MAAESKPGTNKLANVMVKRMRRENASDPVCEFGEIQKNLSLLSDSYPIPIRKGEYSVLSNAAGKFSPGDRVLIVWAGNEAVVVDTVRSS